MICQSVPSYFDRDFTEIRYPLGGYPMSQDTFDRLAMGILCPPGKTCHESYLIVHSSLYLIIVKEERWKDKL